MPAQRSNTKFRNPCPSIPCTDADELFAHCPAATSHYFVNLPVTSGSTCVRVDSDAANMQAEHKGRKELATFASSSKTPDVYFPETPELRDVYRTKLGKKLTAHQWDVYDFILTIPIGKVTTYKDVALAAGGSPRSVGNALRNNPFAPYVPCHRVIASNFFIGGFFGEWGKDHKTGTRYNQKLEILAREGVQFNDKGQLIGKNEAFWHP